MLHKIYGWGRGRVGWGGGWGRVGWGGMITFLGLEYMVDATQDLRLGSGGVGWDDNVPWP